MRSYEVLLVEDNADDEALAIEALVECGVSPDRIRVARDGQEALDALQEFSEKSASDLPKLVLLDLKLPKVGGTEVLRKIRADRKTHALPVVVFTSSRMEKDVAESYDGGANSFVPKPVDFVAYSEAVAQIESYWLRWNLTASSTGDL